jgi:hypothetical protein
MDEASSRLSHTKNEIGPDDFPKGLNGTLMLPAVGNDPF